MRQGGPVSVMPSIMSTGLGAPVPGSLHAFKTWSWGLGVGWGVEGRGGEGEEGKEQWG